MGCGITQSEDGTESAGQMLPGGDESAASGLVSIGSKPGRAPLRLPEWLRRPPGSNTSARDVKRLLRTSSLNTVCEEARCPNIGECFGHGTATFMILGDICTRGCRFCAVHTGKPVLAESTFAAEGERVAEAAATLGLKHVVVTSVARDDLKDGGASGFVETILALKRSLPHVTVEVLVPDFRGNWASVEKIAEAGPDVFNHNLETVPRLYRRVRPGAGYERSLELLKHAKSCRPQMQTKTGVMLGLGEERSEIEAVLADARAHQVDIFTAGQYMQPTRGHLPVERYLTPAEFDEYKAIAESIGFRHAFFGPLVRSSYHAGEFVDKSHSDPARADGALTKEIPA